MGWLNAGTETYWTKVRKHPFFQQKHWDIDGICKLDCKTETGMEHIDTKNREDAKDGMMLCWGFYFIDLWLQRSYEKISVYNGVFWFHLMKRKWHSKGSITLEKHHQSSSSNRQWDHDFVGSNQNVCHCFVAARKIIPITNINLTDCIVYRVLDWRKLPNLSWEWSMLRWVFVSL